MKSVRKHCAIALVHDWHIGKGHRDSLVKRFAHYGWFAPDEGLMHTAICSDLVWVEQASIPGGRPDLLLVYRKPPGAAVLQLVRLGSHSELFG